MKYDPWSTTADGTGVLPFLFPESVRSWSLQQESFFGELVDGNTNLELNARAGTGKTTSCREGMHRLLKTLGRGKSIRYSTFAKSMADEFSANKPASVDAGTLHSFGFRAMARSFGSKFDKNKTYIILDGLGQTNLKKYLRKSVASLVSAFKSQDPAVAPDWETLDTLALFMGIECWHQEDAVYQLTREVIEESDRMTSIIDYDDMLRLPCICGVRFPAVDFSFQDESQDLSPVQHALATLMSGSGRTIVVGDPFQSIYAFRGADSESMPKLKALLGARSMPLTITRRCPKSHVELARRYVPDFEAAGDAPDGVLETGDIEMLVSAGPGDLVLCRANAPLVRHCLRAIADRRRATVKGRALGDSLLAVVRRLGSPSTIGAFGVALDRWKSMEIERLKDRDGTGSLMEAVTDRASCLDAIASSCESPAEIPGVIGQLFSEGTSADRITFSTVHRAKGGEADTVYLIDVPYSEARDRVNPPQPWELDQRRNLSYVARTRSRNRLVIVNP